MPPAVGQPETVFVTWRDKNGTLFDPANVRIRYQGPGVAPVTVTTPSGLITRGATGSGYCEFTIPPQTQAGPYLYRWEALDSGLAIIAAPQDGGFYLQSSSFGAQQPGTFPYPYGYILQTANDFSMIRDALGFSSIELPDAMIGEPEFEPAAEVWVWRRVKNWQLIMALIPPAAPTLSAVANASSTLLATTYYVRLVARVGTTMSSAGAEATQAISPGQALTVTTPPVPGITGYDGYVGTAPGVEYLQPALTNIAPGATATLLSYFMASTPVQEVGIGDLTMLKSTAAAVTASFLCRRFQRLAPASLKTLTYQESFTHSWREEEAAYLANAQSYLGQISTFVLSPPPALAMGRPAVTPIETGYRPGSDPLAIPSLIDRD